MPKTSNGQQKQSRTDEPAPKSATLIALERADLQKVRIKEIGTLLDASGFDTVRAKAEVLGLSRMTTWTILRGTHKCSGLSAATILRMLAAPRLPPAVRTAIQDYIKEKAAGHYGHSKHQLRKFFARLPDASAP